MFYIAFILAFFLMEFAAWATHKYVMHGFLWNLHEDHHKPSGELFQKNDLFFLIFAIPSWLCIMLGFIYQAYFSIGFGFGIAAYGLAYFLIHDVVIHRRFKWFDNSTNKYFRALRNAHRNHHKQVNKEGGSNFGMLFFPKKHWQE